MTTGTEQQGINKKKKVMGGVGFPASIEWWERGELLLPTGRQATWGEGVERIDLVRDWLDYIRFITIKMAVCVCVCVGTRLRDRQGRGEINRVNVIVPSRWCMERVIAYI